MLIIFTYCSYLICVLFNSIDHFQYILLERAEHILVHSGVFSTFFLLWRGERIFKIELKNKTDFVYAAAGTPNILRIIQINYKSRSVRIRSCIPTIYFTDIVQNHYLIRLIELFANLQYIYI